MILAAGASTRYGRLKQLDPVGPSGETLMDYGVYDASRAGCRRVVFVVRRETEDLFRRHAAGYGAALEAEVVTQERAEPASRTTPWGTGHAVLAARHAVREPFLVVNADDFYGASSYSRLARHLRDRPGDGPGPHALIGFPLRGTLSQNGGVSRAVCETDADGRLARLEECRDLVATDGHVVGCGTGGQSRTFSGHETVSMNIWAFDPSVFAPLGNLFDEFLARFGDHPDREFLLSTAANDLIVAGRARFQVVPAANQWFGMTFAADREATAARIAALVETGAYPRTLFPI